MRLIDADELLQCGADVVRDCGLYCDFGYSADIIDEQPTVDAVQVVHGRWNIVEEPCGGEHYQCSQCGEEWVLNDGTPKENNMNFCPKCGAKMDRKG